MPYVLDYIKEISKKLTNLFFLQFCSFHTNESYKMEAYEIIKGRNDGIWIFIMSFKT